jgi:hypothetical protein
VNVSGYPTERRPALSADELVDLFGIPAGGRVTPEAVAVMADCLEGLDELVLVGLVVDAGELAADLEQPASVRRLAAGLASACESAVTASLCDWDAVWDMLEAGKAARRTRTERKGWHG